MKFFAVTLISLASIVCANAGYLQTPHLLQSNSISSYSAHQSFPGASSYQSFETLGLPLQTYSHAPAIAQSLGYPYASAPLYSPVPYIPRQHVTLGHPQLISYPIHNQPALIAQNPAFIQQYPSFIQQPALINPQAPQVPQNPSEQQNGISSIPSGAQVDADTVSVEAGRSSANQAQDNDDDSVTIEAAGRSLAQFKSSNDTTQAIFPSTTEASTSTSESSAPSTESNAPSARSNDPQTNIDEQFKHLNQARLNLESNQGVITRSFFGNPAVFARFNLQ